MKFFLSILILLLGMLFFIIGIKFLYEMYKFKKTAVKTIATVIEIKTSTGRNWNKTYSPVLSFKTADGITHVYDVSAFYKKKYNIGQQIEVVYSQENVKNVKINSFKYILMTPVALFVMGLIGIGISILLFYKK